MDNCLFCGIVAGAIPSKKAYEDDKITAFWDINPQAPVHVLIIPNSHVTSANHLEEHHQEVTGYLLGKAQAIAEQLGVGQSGYRLVVNTGPDAQMSVPHLHVHLLGGRPMSWPPG